MVMKKLKKVVFVRCDDCSEIAEIMTTFTGEINVDFFQYISFADVYGDCFYIEEMVDCLDRYIQDVDFRNEVKTFFKEAFGDKTPHVNKYKKFRKELEQFRGYDTCVICA
jgi:hypothetical protein